MGLFDMINEENNSGQNIATASSKTNTVDNADFLIITDDTPAVTVETPIIESAPMVELSSEDIPDSAVKLFGENEISDTLPIVELATEIQPEVSFFSEETSELEPITSEENALFSEETNGAFSLEASEEEIAAKAAEMASKREEIASLKLINASDLSNFDAFEAPKSDNSLIVNPIDFIKRTIVDLETWKSGQASLKQKRTMKMDEIKVKVDGLKEESKKLSEEIKFITEQEFKVEKTIEILKQQKI